MPIITPPKIVLNAMKSFVSERLKNEQQRRHIANYLTGLLISNNKTVSGMTNEMPNASDQSCLNRFINNVDWDVKEINNARIAWLQKFDDTKFHERGVIALDDVLIDKTGKNIPDSGTFWDHANERYKHAQDLIIINYVNPSGKHYPIDFRRFKKEDQCEWTGEQFKSMITLSIELINLCHTRGVLGTFTFDSFYTCSEIQNHINTLQNADGTQRGYVGDLKFNRKIVFKGVEQQVADFARNIPASDRKSIVIDGVKQWYLTVCVKLPNVAHKVRIVILWKHKNDAEPRKILVTNKIHWNVGRIVETYRGRWTGTETFHRDGKQELGLGDCQLRDAEGQTRHTYLVFLAHSLLVQELDKTNVSGMTSVKLTTIGESCRELLHESIRTIIAWIVEHVEDIVRTGGNVTRRLNDLLHRLGLGTPERQ
jgi:hypothetical protein